jgi:hypothetical protein
MGGRKPSLRGLIMNKRPSKYLLQMIRTQQRRSDYINLVFNAIQDGRRKAMVTMSVHRSEIDDLNVGVGSEEHCAMMLWHLVTKKNDPKTLETSYQMMKQLAVTEALRRKYVKVVEALRRKYVKSLDNVEVLGFDLRKVTDILCKTADDFSIVIAGSTRAMRETAARNANLND